MRCGCVVCPFEFKTKDVFYEVHVTVFGDLKNFSLACKDLGVKDIVVENLSNDGSVLDMFTSHHFKGSDDYAFSEMDRVVRGLSSFDIVRKKIETVPWHPLSPKKNNNRIHLDGQYFEAHIDVSERLSDQRVKYSKNVKKNNLLGTYRDKLIWEEYEENLKFISPDNKHVVEWAMYDSNELHDSKWLQ